MSAFDALPAALQAALSRLHISLPTPVQQAALPPALKGHDVLATSQTGTGKTFAFLLPLLVRLQQSPDTTALILSPTRELAQQTQEALYSLLSAPEEMPSALIIGGDNIHKQYADLRRKPRIIIGTPGRVIDHIGRKSLTLKNTSFVVLDEADRMLDMGFIPDVRKICSAVPGARQTFLFSATLPKEIEELAEGFLHNPVRVQIGSVTRPVDLVLQQFIRLNTREKLPQLVHELHTRKGLVLVFVKSRHGAERLAKQLKLYGCKVAALHGDLRQSRRRQVMEQFRLGDVAALVATDVAARGIDVDGITCVINYDLPQCPEDYIHRIGRTGRAGSVGTALSFVTEDKEKWAAICRVCRLGKLTELTKTSQVLPAPKFVPGAPLKKKESFPCAEAVSKEGNYTKSTVSCRAEAKRIDRAEKAPRPNALARSENPKDADKTYHLKDGTGELVPLSIQQRHARPVPMSPTERGAVWKKGRRRDLPRQAMQNAPTAFSAHAETSAPHTASANHKPIATFHKASHAAAVLAQGENENSFWAKNSVHILRVGSKKKAAALVRDNHRQNSVRLRRAETDAPAASGHKKSRRGTSRGRQAGLRTKHKTLNRRKRR